MAAKLFVLVAMCVALGSPLYAHAALKDTLEVSGWIPYWRAATGTADVLPHLTSLTTLHPFGYIVTKDGVLYDAMSVADEPWAGLRTRAKASSVRFVPSIMWSDSEAMHHILSSKKLRTAFVEDILDTIEREGFDGIDIDFENKYAKTNKYFSLFLKELAAGIGKKWLYCTIEPRTPLSSRYIGTPPKDAGVYANDYKEINKYCDRVQIMVYDQGAVDAVLNKAADGPYIPVADIAWAEKVMKLAAQTIDKKKLVIGIPTYGYEYEVEPLAEGFRYHRLWSFNQKYANEIAEQFNLTPTRGSSGELSLTYIPTSTPRTLGVPTSANAVGPAAASTRPFNILWWSDADAVASKIALARTLGLRGVAIFKFDGGQDPRIWPLLK